MWWVDAIVIVIFLISAYFGYHRGLIFVAMDLAGFILSLVVAAVFFNPAGDLLGNWLATSPMLTDALAFILIMLSVQLVYSPVARQLYGGIPKQYLHAGWNAWAGSFLNGAKALVFVALYLIVFAALPLRSYQKETVTTAKIPAVLLKSGGAVQQKLSDIVGKGVEHTINFLTVKPQSDETVELGYKIEDVAVNEAAERRMLELVNQERAKHGLRQLEIDHTIVPVARSHSRDMFARGYFSHTNPDGLGPFDRMRAGKVDFLAAGENLALAPTVEMAHNGLMNSPGHRANILSPEFSRIGIGAIDGGRYGIMFTQNFAD